MLLGLGLSGCGTTQSLERSSDGSTVYLDKMSGSAKAEARQNIVQQLNQDVPVFRLDIGDELSVFFDVSPRPTPGDYLVSVSDKLYIGFLNDPENSGTITVSPDGSISLPRIGTVMAAGQTAGDLGREIERRYGGIISQPQITVNVIESHSPMDRFIAMLGASAKNGSLSTRVLPDGTIVVPLLPPLEALGRTLEQVQHEIDGAYSALGMAVTVSLVPRVLYAGSTMVFGEVGKPGRIALNRPHTVLMAVAEAGGVLPTGSIQSVRVFYIGGDGNARVRMINLAEVMDQLKLEDDMIVPDNSIIYVPPTELVKAARVSKTIAELMQFNGYGFNFDYIINQPSSTTATVVGH
ncbi:MAG: polysaccharide biosynthesis/export family protein [Candidatus Binataceae bacterium]|jgi:polysaccharide export outer membrane protein